MANNIGWGKAHENNSITFGGDVSCGSTSFDTDYQAVLDYATTQGYTLPSAGQQALQDQLVVDLKAAGVWSKLDALGVRATDGDSDFALIDWKRLITTTAVNSPTFITNQGFKGDGSSSYIDNLFRPLSDGVNYTQNSSSIGSYINDDNIQSLFAFNGCLDANSQSFILSSGGNVVARINTTNGVSSPLTNSNFYLGNQTGTAVNVYGDGVLVQSSARTPLTPPDASSYSLASNSSGSAANFSSAIDSIWLAGGNLTAEQADFNTAIQNYITAL